MAKLFVPAALDGISAGLDFIEEELKKLRIKRREIQEAMLLSEESMVRMIGIAPDGEEMHISIKRRRGLAVIKISVPGPKLDMNSDAGPSLGIEGGGLGRENEDTIRTMLLHAYTDKIHYVRKGRYNFMEITAGSPERSLAIWTAAALAAALVVGLLQHFILPDAVRDVLNDYVLMPIEIVFINALKLVTAPTVFFSIITAFCEYTSFSDPGRVSIKVVAGYLCTSALAVLVGWSVFRLLEPGTAGQLAAFSAQTAAVPAEQQTSLFSALIGIVPSNIIEPLLEVNTAQLIFLALLFGVAMGRAGEYTAGLRRAAEAMCALCGKATAVIVRFIPIATFASTVSILQNIGGGALVSLLEMMGAVLLGSAVMIFIYFFIITPAAGIGPLPFIRKYTPLMWEAFLGGSSTHVIPKTMRCCKNALGVSPKVYSFSIPFGALANMDGNCIYLTIGGLFLARMCGLELFSGNMLLPLLFSILVLSVGAPITPGSALLCLTILMSQMGVSLSAIGILLGVNALIEMLQAMTNTAGDVAITLAVARSEKLLDLDAYKAAPRRRGKALGK